MKDNMGSYQEEVIPVQQRFKVEKEPIEDSFEPDKDLSHVSPISHGIKAEKHTDVYKMHRYFARRPHNVFKYLIDHYSNKDNIILDPFCGGGVTVIEGLRLKRKVIGVDFNPLATFVTRTEVMDFDVEKFEEYFERIKNSVEKQINKLYEVKCPGCGKVLIGEWFGWDVVLHCKECKNNVVIRDAKKILNKAGRGTGKFECPHCKNILVAHTDKINEIPTVISVRCSCGYEGGKNPDENDLKNLAGIDRKLKKYEQKGYWYPKDEIPKGDKTKEALNKGYKYFYELFTNRNLLALSILLKEIEEIKDKNCELLFKLAFSQTLAGATKLCNDPISGWQAHAYWIPNQMFEMNVWGYFKRNVKAVLEGKTDSKNTIGDYFKEAKSFQDLLGDKTCLILTKSSTDLKGIIPDESIDVVITDPPYGGNVNYSELSNFWAVWLKEELGLGNRDLIDNTEEAIENRTQNKGPNEYQDILFGVLKEAHRVLKKDRWLVMTFHNRKFAVWKALHLAAYDAGFMLPARHGIIYQSPIAAYTYTFHQRAGGAMLGDFLVSFKRSDSPPKKDFETTLNRGEHGKLMAEVKKVIEFHGGATDNMIFMQLMPFLMNSGLLHKVGVENLDSLLDKSLFVKINDKWHLKENIDEQTGKVKPISLIPAEQRIEQLIRSLLLEKGVATMDEILVAVFTNLINGDTPTNEEITHVLDRICSRNGKAAKRTVFRLKKQIDLGGEIKKLSKGKKADIVKRKAKVKQKLLSGEVVEMGDEEGGMHSTMIHNLYKLGKEKGYEVHIGHTEQRKSKMFNEISYPMVSNVQFGVSNEVFSVIREIDVLWITKGNTITHAFEIEATTNIITGISRFRELFVSAPNITINTFIAVAEKRRVLAINKINSPANRKEGISERIKCITFEDISGKQLDF